MAVFLGCALCWSANGCKCSPDEIIDFRSQIEMISSNIRTRLNAQREAEERRLELQLQEIDPSKLN